jgi:hypothetical protein
VEAKSARIEGDDVLLVSVTVEGTSCGKAWLATRPEAVDVGHVRLVGSTALTREPSDTMQALIQHIERVAILKPEFSFAEARNQIENLFGALSQGLTGEATLSLNLGPPAALPPDVVPDGLELWSALEIAAVAQMH